MRSLRHLTDLNVLARTFQVSLIHLQSYQTVAAKGIRHADGKALTAF